MALFPSVYSLNSGFDTGKDSWFSSGAWQVGTPVQKMPARYRCSVGGREQAGGGGGPRGLDYHFLSGLTLVQTAFALIKKKAEEESVTVHHQGGERPKCSFFTRARSHAHIHTQCHDLHGRAEQVVSILVIPHS